LSQRFHECDQVEPVGSGQRDERLLRESGLTPVPEDGLGDTARSAVV
jgi:hypothetical protein